MRKLRPLVLVSSGGLLYILCEFVFRGYSHWTMFFVGGVCFWLIGLINEAIQWDMPLWKQCIISAIVITAVEFLSGYIINLWLGWNVWDYSDVSFNFLGQICLPFTLLWMALSLIGIVLDDYLRYWFFKEEIPQYKLF